MKQKLIFLDIDGTLLPPGEMLIPQSTVEALRKARANGHKLFLCTGRNLRMTQPLLDYGFDGAVCSAGGYVFCGGKVLVDMPMEPQLAEGVRNAMERHGVECTLEARDATYGSLKMIERWSFTHRDAGPLNSEAARWRKVLGRTAPVMTPYESSLAAALILFAAISCGRSRMIENPYCERAEMLRVLRVETLDTATVVDVAVIGYPDNWFMIEGDRQSGELYLTGRRSGRHYRYLGSDDLIVRHRYTHDSTGIKRFTMRFEPLDPADRQGDLTADVSASFNVEGIFLTPPDSLRKGPVCRVEGVLHDRPATTMLMLCRWTDYDGNARDLVSKSRAIPVTDGRFGFNIPADDDLYVLIPWNEYAVSAWYDCEFFAEKGKVRIEWGAEAPTAIIGGGSFILYGMISAIGVRNLVENRVDLAKSRNVIVVSLIISLALGITFSTAGAITFHVGEFTLNFSGLAVAAIVGIVVNAILPGKDYNFQNDYEYGKTTEDHGQML